MITGNGWPKYFLEGTQTYDEHLDLAVSGITWAERDAVFNEEGRKRGLEIRRAWRKRQQEGLTPTWEGLET